MRPNLMALGILLIAGLPSYGSTVADISTGVSSFQLISDTTGEANARPAPAPIISMLGNNWVTVAGTSWIGPSSNQSSSFRGSGFGGTSVYTTTFGLAGFNPLSAAITGTFTGDDAVTILLNGNTIFNSSPGSMWTTIVTLPSVPASDFVAGVNTLAFAVFNSGNGATGLDGHFIVTANSNGISAISNPETGLIFPLGAALLGGAVLLRRRSVRHSAA